MFSDSWCHFHCILFLCCIHLSLFVTNDALFVVDRCRKNSGLLFIYLFSGAVKHVSRRRSVVGVNHVTPVSTACSLWRQWGVSSRCVTETLLIALFQVHTSFSCYLFFLEWTIYYVFIINKNAKMLFYTGFRCFSCMFTTEKSHKFPLALF